MIREQTMPEQQCWLPLDSNSGPLVHLLHIETWVACLKPLVLSRIFSCQNILATSCGGDLYPLSFLERQSKPFKSSTPFVDRRMVLNMKFCKLRVRCCFKL